MEKFSVKKQLRSEAAMQLSGSNPLPNFSHSHTDNGEIPPSHRERGHVESCRAFPPQWGRARVGADITTHHSLKKVAFTLAEVLFHPAEQSRRIAFTLAEVLITLGIIGVVAALTMPSLIQNHRKTVVETRLAKFYSTMNQAIRLAEVDNGEKSDWGVIEAGVDKDGNSNALVWLNKYLIPYTQIAKIEQIGTNVHLYFPDGSLVDVSYATWRFYPEARDFKTSIKYGGTKLFTFAYFPEKGIEPYQYSASTYHLSNWDVGGCKLNISNTERPCCAALIKRNGWKIPKDYPLKF